MLYTLDNNLVYDNIPGGNDLNPPVSNASGWYEVDVMIYNEGYTVDTWIEDPEHPDGGYSETFVQEPYYSLLYSPTSRYIINGRITTLNENGTGEFEGLRYENGSLFTGEFEGLRHENGFLFTGEFEGLRYENGSLFTGEFEGQTYVNGVLQNGGGGGGNGGGGSVNLASGLQAFYKLSDLSDSSGNNRTLTNNGNVSFASGKIGNAAVFDGTNSLDSNFVVPDTGDFTITSWFNPAGGPFALVGNTKEWAQGFFEIGSSDPGSQDGKIRLFSANSTEIVGVATDDQFTESVWNHVAVRRSGSTFNIWLNGVLQSASYEYSGSLESDSLTLGKSTYTHFNGSMDAVGIWNRALSDAEVAELYNNGTGLELPAGPAVKNGWIDNIFWINDVATTLDQNGDGTWVGKLYENGSLFSGTKYELTFVDGVAQPVQVVTVVGNDVPVAFGLNEQSEPLVQLVFASITNAGETTVEQIAPTVLPVGIPAQYTAAQTVLAYSIDTTATFTGTINVDFVLPANISQTVFNRVKGFHVKNNGTVEEMARVASDFATKKITVAITSFSSFLFLDEPPQQSNKSVKVVGKSKFVGKVKFA